MAKTFSFDRSIASDNPMTSQEHRSAEQSLASLVAAAFEQPAHHPELFDDKRRDVHIMGIRPEQSARHLLRDG